MICAAAPDCAGKMGRELAAQGARQIGGCCGTTPRTIAAMAAALKGLEPARSKTVRAIVEPVRVSPPKVAAPSVPALPGPRSTNMLPIVDAGKSDWECWLGPFLSPKGMPSKLIP